ncbi:hypothetical protein ACP70R_043089 [Stipagrostis hirtigluma subsp. patula]
MESIQRRMQHTLLIYIEETTRLCPITAMAELAMYLLPLTPLPIVSFLSVSRALSRRRGGGARRLPPSPWALPVIGHLHHLVGALPHRAFRDLARRHGPLLLLRLGELPVVVASSAAAAREVMRTRDLELATRPASRVIRHVFPEGTEGIFFAPYGDGWRQVRKICTVELLSAKRVLSFRSVREEEAGRLLRAVVASTPAKRAVNLSELLSLYSTSSSVRTVIGRRLKNPEAFLRILLTGVKMFARMSLPDLFPSSRLAMLVSRVPGRMKMLRQELVEFLDAMIRDHEENRAAGDDKAEDLLDVLMRIHRHGDLEVPFTTDNIRTVVGDIFAGGIETTATTLTWITVELVRNPRVMQKAQEEIRRVLAGRHRVSEDDLGSLHYMHLVIKEALRLHPPALFIPRECRSPCQVLGFDMPVGTMVLVNVWAISRDPKYWDEPEEFKPERFEQRKLDFLGTDFEYTPFGAGRRMCPGMALGLSNVALVLTSLLYHFDWELPRGAAKAAELDMTEEMGVTARRLQDLLLLPVVRVPLPVD